MAQRGDRPRRNRGDRTAAAHQPYQGVFLKGEKPKGLFPIKQTGVDTAPVRQAADAFLAGLTDEQRKAIQFTVDDVEWRKWDNRHSYARQGVSFETMTAQQRELAFAFMGSALSARGLKQSQDIMKLNGTLEELTKRPGYGEWNYFLTFMGKPSAKEPWGWQMDGHHLAINYFVLGDQVVMSPVFMGSEPVLAEAGKFKGTIICQEEQDAGLAMINALTKAQQAKAVVSSDKAGTNNKTEAFTDNLELEPMGVLASEFDAKQKAQFLELISIYVGNMRDAHTKVKMSEVEAHLDATRFGWIGATDKDSVFYYRIHSPVILIEFDHQRPIGLERTGKPTRQHIHTVVRTPNGNDYGKDLLRQHLEQHHK
jgi:hypothetical protein